MEDLSLKILKIPVSWMVLKFIDSFSSSEITLAIKLQTFIILVHIGTLEKQKS
jgi:hypothetical protein